MSSVVAVYSNNVWCVLCLWQHVFKLEQEEYLREEIEWKFIEFYDNQPCTYKRKNHQIPQILRHFRPLRLKLWRYPLPYEYHSVAYYSTLIFPGVDICVWCLKRFVTDRFGCREEGGQLCHLADETTIITKEPMPYSFHMQRLLMAKYRWRNIYVLPTWHDTNTYTYVKLS